jgi:hypothetical protein
LDIDSGISSGHNRAPCSTRRMRTFFPTIWYAAMYGVRSRDVWCAVNDQLARAFDTTGPATLGKLPQLLHMPLNAIVHDNCSSWTIRFDVVEDGFPVRQCEQ